MDIAGDLTGRGHVSSRPGRTTTTASIPSDQGAPPAELGTYGPKTNPYTVMGKRYYPLQTANGYDVVGTASWYGSENHGLQTASGSIYNMYSMSAAHKTLPLGTIVRVENLENGRNVELLVNDRGPFIGERIIDLSYGAAKRIGFDAKGLARVRVVAI
ncbi:MAG: septal ring lytic transglycosylase RlpA family protein, partial [Proteobacteria bacterium]|nr:septal ring lytic transglycosylase RlpA family protein [Pseudomonadota bacterium]